MIEIIEGLPDNVLGIVVKGRVSKRDRSDVLMPAIEKALKWHHRLRLYYEIRTRFPGAGWEELTFGAGEGPIWEKVAIVTDTAWMRHTVTALRLLIPADIQVFTTSQMAEGLSWITDATLRTHWPKLARGLLSTGGDSRAFRPPPQYLHQAF